MRKLLLFSIVIFAVQVLSAQAKFRIAVHDDLVTYDVFMRAEVDLPTGLNTVRETQLTLSVPTGGFEVGNIVPVNGTWGLAAHYRAPEENNRFDYLVFSFNSLTTSIPFVTGQETLLFSFKNIGVCKGELTFIENDTDPFWPPNSISGNIGNSMAVLGLGQGVNGYNGTYYQGGYDCATTDAAALCGITFNGIDFVSPSTCGASDGSLCIFVTNDTGFDLQYSIDNGGTYQSSPKFTGLTSGDYSVVVRDILSICIEDIGTLNVPGPLGPLVISHDVVNPDCGTDNGSITLHARTDHGDPIEYSIDGGNTFQTDSTFTGLGEGSYTFVLRNSANNCETISGPYELTGCDPVTCLVEFEIEQTSGGRYQVVMVPDTTWSTPWNQTSSLQAAFRAETGGFVLDDLRTEVPGAIWSKKGEAVGPSVSPGYDYFLVGLESTTSAINYIKGQRIVLFSFTNIGTCMNGNVELVENGVDPIGQDMSFDFNQQLFVLALTDDVPICLNDNRSVPCETTPVPCVAAFEMDQLSGGGYQVSMTPDTTLTGTKAFTIEMGVTVKVPTGTFTLGNLQPASGVSGITVTAALEASAPAAAPGFDYYNITIGPSPTDLIPYTKGQKTPIFTFENTGDCAGADVKIIDTETDAYDSATAGLFLKVSAFGSDRVKTCLNDASFPDCPPAMVQRDTVYVTMTTDMATTEAISAVLDLPNGTGTATVLTDGSFVTATVTNGSDNVDLNPNGDFRQTDVITVVHCDATMTTLCDTTVIIICPQVQIAPVTPACAGSNFQITTTGGAGNFNWSGATLTGMNPMINLTETTTLTLNTDDGNGCATTADVTISVNALPRPSFTFTGTCSGEETVFTNTTPGNITDFAWEFGAATNTSDIENPTFTFGADGVYDVTLAVTDANGCSGSVVQPVTILGASTGGSRQDFTICAGDTLNFQAMGGGTDFVWSPSNFLSDATIANPQATPPRSLTYTVTSDGGAGGCGATVDTFHVNVNPSPIIIEVLREDVADCDNPDGSIKITATEPNGDPLEYSIDCGVTWQTNSYFPDLGKGDYAPTVRNATTGCISLWSKNFTVSGPSSPRIANVASTQPTDCGEKDGTITFSSPDANVLFSIDGSDFVADSVFTGLEAKRYFPQAKFNGDVCVTNDAPVTLQGGDEPILAAPINELFVCESNWKTVKIAIDDLIETYTITTTGTYSNEMKTDSVLSFDVASPADSVEYSVELKVANGCSVTEDFTAYKAENPTVIAKELEGSACLVKEGSFVLTLSGGTAPYTFDLLDPNNDLLFNDSSIAGDMPINELSAGDHKLELADTYGCLSKTTVTIDLLSSDFNLTEEINHPNCNQIDGSIILSATGDSLTFEWKNVNDVVISNDSLATDLAAGDVTAFISSDATGCFQELTFTLENMGAPELVIENLMPVFCEGDANGGVAFYVNGNGEFYVKISDAGIDTTVQGGESTMVFGLTGGTYDMVVEDDGGCETIQEITIIENVMNIKADKIEPTQCDLADGNLCLTLTDGTGPYQISGAFTMSDVAEGDEVCFNNIESGRYEIQITDANNCEKSRTLVFAAANQPVISTDSFAVTGLICPEDGDNGSIISTGASVYSVYNSDGALIGLTPVDDLAPQTVVLIERVSGCDAILEIELTAPKAWSTEAFSTEESCDGDDATIDLTVAGANGNYQYEWETGVTHIDGAATGLTEGTYQVTITDGEGCETILTDIKVKKDSTCITCQPLFEREVFNVTVSSSFPQVCLPLTDSNIAGQSITLNGSPYGGFATICSSDVISYDVATLVGTGTAPFTLNGWFYGTTNLGAGFTFFTIQELVDKMNEVTPDGNWQYDEVTQIIIGEGVMFFGDIVVAHAGASELIMVSSTSEGVVRTAVEIPGGGTHVLILLDDMGDCPDTLTIIAVEEFDGPDYPDSIAISTIMETTSNDMCRVDNLSFPAGAILTICETPDNGSVEINGTCYNYTPAPEFLGVDDFCIEICDGNDCQQIRVMVTVTSRDIVIYTGFSPNGDGVNDALIIENIEAFPNNTLSVYNRWGNLVFKQEGYTNVEPWIGDFDGATLPDGTYFIILETGEGEQMTNYIQIIR